MNLGMQLLSRLKRLEDKVARMETREQAILHGLSALTDPGSDKILFWDDSEGVLGWLEPNTNLSITGTDLDAS